MPLHPQAKEFLETINTSHRIPLQTLGAKKAREAYAERPNNLAPPWVTVFSIENRLIQHNHLSIFIRVYTPKKSPSLLPICIFYHGGGMVIGSLDGYDTLCRQMCVQSNCIIVSVDYRLAPEHKFPAAIDDAYSAFLWVKQHAKSIGGNSEKLAVSGDSAGGSLAAAVTLLARDRNLTNIKCQVLVYPANAPYADSPSHFAFAKGYFLERETVLWFHESYIRSDKDREDFRYAPLIANDLAHLPPALIILAAYDTLRDEGEAYANRLTSSGVEVDVEEYKGMFHPFISLAGVLDDGKKAIASIADYLHQHLH